MHSTPFIPISLRSIVIISSHLRLGPLPYIFKMVILGGIFYCIVSRNSTLWQYEKLNLLWLLAGHCRNNSLQRFILYPLLFTIRQRAVSCRKLCFSWAVAFVAFAELVQTRYRSRFRWLFCINSDALCVCVYS
jgi:hypothetical protein